MRIIAGTHRGRRIHAPKTSATRPILDQQKEALFNILRDALPCEGVVDVFAGSGSLGLEALSRGAGRATFVERGPKALDALRRNIGELGFGGVARVLPVDAFRIRTDGLGHGYSLAFVDPPFPVVLAEPARVAALCATLCAARRQDTDGCVVLRIPGEAAGPDFPGPGPAVVDERTFGESRILLLR